MQSRCFHFPIDSTMYLAIREPTVLIFILNNVFNFHTTKCMCMPFITKPFMYWYNHQWFTKPFVNWQSHQWFTIQIQPLEYLTGGIWSWYLTYHSTGGLLLKKVTKKKRKYFCYIFLDLVLQGGDYPSTTHCSWYRKPQPFVGFTSSQFVWLVWAYTVYASVSPDVSIS